MPVIGALVCFHLPHIYLCVADVLTKIRRLMHFSLRLSYNTFALAIFTILKTAKQQQPQQKNKFPIENVPSLVSFW